MSSILIVQYSYQNGVYCGLCAVFSDTGKGDEIDSLFPNLPIHVYRPEVLGTQLILLKPYKYLGDRKNCIPNHQPPNDYVDFCGWKVNVQFATNFINPKQTKKVQINIVLKGGGKMIRRFERNN